MKNLTFLKTITLLLFFTIAGFANNPATNGSPTDWYTASAWTTSGVPNLTHDQGLQDVVVSHNMYVGNLTVSNGENITISGNYSLSWNESINVEAGGTLNITGSLLANNSSTSVTIDGNLNVGGNYKVSSSNVSHNLNGNVTVGGFFRVQGGNTVYVRGGLDITGELRLTSNGRMQGYSGGHVTYGSYDINNCGGSYLSCSNTNYGDNKNCANNTLPPANGMDFSTCGAYTPTVCDSDANNTTSTDPIRETQTKSLVGTPSGGSWSIVSGGGSISSSTYSSANITANKSIKIRYTIAADGSCPATTSDRTFTVTPVADNTTTNATITELQTKTLIATPSGGSWSIVSGGGSISGSTYTPANITANTGVTIRYTYAGTTSDRPFTVTPVADNTTATNSITELQTKTLTATPSGGAWSIVSGGGSISGSTYTPANITTKTSVKIRYTFAGTTSDRTFTVTPVADNTTTNATITELQTKTLIATPAGGTWSIVSGGGSISGSTYTPANINTNTNVKIRYTFAGTISERTFLVTPICTVADNTTTTASITEGQTKNLTGTPSGGSWSLVSGGGSITGSTYTPANINTNTTVKIRYTIAADGSCPATTDDVTFTVTPVCDVVADNTTATAAINEGETKTLTGAPSGGTWSIVAGSGSITGSTYTPTDINTAASVTIRYTIAADGACVATTDDVTFTVTPVCAVASNTTSTASITELQTKSLEGSPSGGTWSIVSGGGSITDATYTPADITADTSITIKYTIASDGSCDATTSVRTFTVTPVVIFWNGSEDNDWSNVNNWSTNYLPANNNAVVVIPGGLSNYPTATEPVSVNSVIMNSGSSLIAKEIFTGALTYRRTLSNWHLIASPVFGETIENMYLKNNFIQAGNGDIGLAPYQHDSNTWGFYKDTSTGAITSGQGYSSKLASLGDVSFTGTMATTDISISSIGRTIDYNLVGNPYPSYLNIESFLNDNSDSLEEMTLWMDSYDVIEQKSVYQPISLVSNLKHIAPAQGFFVQPKEESTVLNFTEDMQSHQSVDTFEKTSSSERPEIKLLITNGTSTKYTDIFYIEGTTTGFDNGYDSSIFNSTASFSLYTNTITNSSGRKLAIQSLPNSDYESMVVPVGIIADADKEITFSATAINLPAGIKVYLEDRELNVFTELVADVYKVDLAAAVNGVGRFYLHTSQKVLDVSDVPILTNIKIYTTTNTNLRIVGLPEAAKALKLYNIIGQEIMSTSFNTNGVKDIALPNLSKGVYTVQLKIGSEIIREKIFLE
jgi:hypothetical protein